MKRAVAVLYVGGTRLSCVIGRPSVNNSFVTLSRADADYSGIVGGEVIDPSELAESLHRIIYQAQRGTKARVDKLYVGAPPQFCDCSVHNGLIEFDKPKRITQRDIKQMFSSIDCSSRGTIINESAVWFKLDGGCPLINAVGMSAQSIQGRFSVTTVADSFVSLMRACLRGTPFKTVAFISVALGKALYLIDEDSRDKTCVMLSSGMFTTSVAVVVGDGIVFLKSFNIGMAHVINDVSIVLGIDFHVANLLVNETILSVRMNEKDNYEVTNSVGKKMKFSAATVNEIIKSRLEVMGESILKTINAADPNLLSKPMFICGGHLDAVAGARDFFGKAIGSHITQCVCPFTKQNKPSEITIQALLNLAIKQEFLK